MNKNLKKIVLALGSLAMVGAVSQASAFPAFSIQPGAVNPLDTVAGGITNLDTIKGGASERLVIQDATHFTGTGLFTLNGFFSGATQKYVPGFSGAAPFPMYLSFTLTDELVSGSLGGVGSTYKITQLDFKIFADVLNNDDFTVYGTATAAAAPTAGTAAQSAEDIMLGYGSIIAGNASIVSSGAGSTGGALNSTQSLFLCTGAGTSSSGSTTYTAATSAGAAGCLNGDGKGFFFAPSPFYSIAFTEFNNTSSVFDPATGTLVLTGGSGSVNFATVPEPDSLALFSIATVGLALAARRRRKSA